MVCLPLPPASRLHHRAIAVRPALPTTRIGLMLISVIRDILKTAARAKEEKREATARRDAATDPKSSRPAAVGVARHHVANGQLIQDGLTPGFKTPVDPVDVERNGVAYSQPMRRSFVGRAG